MRASPRADDMRPRPRRAAGLPEVQEGWQAPGCNAAPACPALAPAAAAGKLNAKLKSDFRCYPNNGHAATASAGPFCANERRPWVLRRLHDSWRLPCPFAYGQDRWRRFLWYVEAQQHVGWSVRRGQPVRFPVFARRVLLNVDGQRPIGIRLHVRQHRRVDEIPVDRVLDELLRLWIIHCDRPDAASYIIP